MRWFKYLVYVSAFIVFTAFKAFAPMQKWVITQSSNLTVNGTTNINKFACSIPAYDKADTLLLTKTDNEITLSGAINLKVNSFDCQNAMMTGDLRKTLRAKEYPCLHIQFLTLNKLPAPATTPMPITGLVNISIAGINRLFEINYQVSTDMQKTIHLIGTRDINFSDFKLIPPRKLGGMIKTNDKLSVAFHLKIKAI